MSARGICLSGTPLRLKSRFLASLGMTREPLFQQPARPCQASHPPLIHSKLAYSRLCILMAYRGLCRNPLVHQPLGGVRGWLLDERGILPKQEVLERIKKLGEEARVGRGRTP